MGSSFRIEVIPERERARLLAAGELDIATADELEMAAADLLSDGFADVVLDLREITFLDSRGIHALLSCQHRARACGTRLRIVRGRHGGWRVLEITGVADQLELEDPSPDGAS